jgi:hypothetical protein
MTVENTLTTKIISKRNELENMIESSCSLNDRNILECSKELDRLIVLYHYFRRSSRRCLCAQ